MTNIKVWTSLRPVQGRLPKTTRRNHRIFKDLLYPRVPTLRSRDTVNHLVTPTTFNRANWGSIPINMFTRSLVIITVIRGSLGFKSRGLIILYLRENTQRKLMLLEIAKFNNWEISLGASIILSTNRENTWRIVPSVVRVFNPNSKNSPHRTS